MGRKIVHPRPDYVKNFKNPENTEIRFCNGSWYLYQIVPGQKNAERKKSFIIGTITPDGLVKSKSRIREEMSKKQDNSDKKLREKNK